MFIGRARYYFDQPVAKFILLSERFYLMLLEGGGGGVQNYIDLLHQPPLWNGYRGNSIHRWTCVIELAVNQFMSCQFFK